MPRPSIVRPLTAVTLSALLVAGMLGTTTQAIASPAQKPLAVDKPERVKGVPKVLRRKDVPIRSRQGAAYSRVPASDGTRSSVVAEPSAGSPRSQWRVTCNGALGFDSSAPCQTAKNAFQSAIDIWARIVASPITINLDVSFQNFADPTLLGSAFSPFSYTNTAGTTLHVSALADALQSRDIALEDYGVANDPDVAAEFTTNPGVNWYFGTDGAAAADQVDFKSVVLHEIGHGLGVAGTMKVDSGGLGSYGGKETGDPAEPFKPIGFDREAFTALTGGSRLIALAEPGAAKPAPDTSAATLGSALTSGSVFWGGTQGVNANGGVRPKLYAPSPFEPGSSFAHLDETTFAPGNANSLMTPLLSANEAIHNPGSIAVGILADQGWTASLPTATAPSAPASVTAAAGNARAQVNWTAAEPNGSAVRDYDVFASSASTSNVLVCDNVITLSCLTSVLVNETAYTFRVSARNDVGTSPLSAASAQVTPSATDTTAPTVTISTPRTFTKAGTTFAFSGSDPTRPDAVLRYTCQFDAAAVIDPCTSARTAPALTDGPHTFKVNAIDEAGNVSPTASDAWVVDTTSPTVSIDTPRTVTKAGTTFAFSGSDPARPDAVLRYTCQFDAADVIDPCTSPRTAPALADGQHTFKVNAIDEAGNPSLAASDSWVIDTAAPIVSIGTRPAENTRSTSASFTVAFSDASPSSGIVSVTCQLNTLAPTACTAPQPYSGLANGVQTFTVRATDTAGNVGTSVDTWRVDTVAPALKFGSGSTFVALAPFSLGSTVGFNYTASDAGSGVASYQITHRKAAFGGSFVNGTAVTRTTAGTFSLTATKGTTYCFTVVAVDRAGNRSAARTGCTASALDDRQLTASTGWSRPNSSAFYAGTVTTAAKSGLVLTRTGVKAKRISLIATKCNGCGTVGVYLNGVLQKQISLNNGGTTKHKQIIPVILYSTVKTGTVTIRTLNAGRVNFDGLGISQV